MRRVIVQLRDAGSEAECFRLTRQIRLAVSMTCEDLLVNNARLLHFIDTGADHR